MNQERYSFKTDATATVYEFVSDGTKGQIPKLVIFQAMRLENYYNLAFGDKDTLTNDLNDLTVSNNGDTHMVLATVAATVIDFTNRYPDAWVFATGSTVSRTRLYRIGIANNLNEVEGLFEVLGLVNEYWQTFEKNTNYEAFLIKRKS